MKKVIVTQSKKEKLISSHLVHHDSFNCIISYIKLCDNVINLYKNIINTNITCVTYESKFIYEYKILKYPIFCSYIYKINMQSYSFYDNCSYINNYIDNFDISNNYITISNYILDISNNRYYEISTNYIFDSKYKKIFYKAFYFYDFFEMCIKNIKPVPNIHDNYLYIYCIFTFNGIACIKIGYTSNLLNRHNSLQKEYKDTKLYLIFWCKIEGEFIEKDFHKMMKINHTEYIMENIYVIKNKAIATEIYKFDFGLMTILLNYLNECYNKQLMNLKQMDITLLTLELDKKKCDFELDKLKMESQKQNNDFELEKQKMELQKQNNEIEKQNNEMELVKLKIESQSNEIELVKLKIESHSNEMELLKLKIESQSNEIELVKLKNN